VVFDKCSSSSISLYLDKSIHFLLCTCLDNFVIDMHLMYDRFFVLLRMNNYNCTEGILVATLHIIYVLTYSFLTENNISYSCHN